MINKEILMIVQSISNEKGVAEEIIFEAIEAALAAVTVKRYDEPVDARVAIDRKTGDYESFRRWTVVDENNLPEDAEEIEPGHQLTLEQAHETDADLQVGDVIEEPIESVKFGRIAAQQVKQHIVQRIREAERNKIIDNYRDRIGELLIGIVKKITRDHLILDMGENAEALMPREDMIPREVLRLNDRIRVYLKEVREERRGPQLLVSRTCPEFLIELFKIEVPEIGEEVIEIRAAARDAGSRAKIAVKTNDGRIDPIGACVGMRGSRVQAVSNELGGERVDIVLWDPNPAQLVINAMAPAEVSTILVDEESHSIDIAVAEDQLSQAIGRGGQNVRLASELTGWTLNVMSEADLAKKHEGETQEVKALFMEKLDVDEDIAEVLANENFTSLEEIAYAPVEDMQAIEGFDADVVEELQRRASDVLLTEEIASDQTPELEPAQDLLDVEGVTEDMAKALAGQGIVTRDDLAEQSVDELQELFEIDEEFAAKLIMAARAHWFEEEQ